MKRVLIAGANSYIGTSLERYLMEYNVLQGREMYRVDTVSQRDPAWENHDFGGYDAVFQASGIAHVDTGAVTQEQQALYYRVNCDLAVATARKAQAAGVGLFLYPSSIIVYGDSAPYGESRMITRQTPANNAHFYGNSKLRAEEELRKLVRAEGEEALRDTDSGKQAGDTPQRVQAGRQAGDVPQQMEAGPQGGGAPQQIEVGRPDGDMPQQVEVGRQGGGAPQQMEAGWQAGKAEDAGGGEMQLAILRLPMVYGRGSKGNYPMLAKLAGRLPFFPDVQNQRSMIYIENLCEFIRQRIEEGRGGLYFPQNAEYTATSRMVQEIAAAHGKKVRLLRAMNPLVALASRMPGKIGAMANKAFGSLTYDRSMSGDMERYCLYDLPESIRRTEGL